MFERAKSSSDSEKFESDYFSPGQVDQRRTCVVINEFKDTPEQNSYDNADPISTVNQTDPPPIDGSGDQENDGKNNNSEIPENESIV